MHDLWRRIIMKFFSKIIGNRDYTLFEVVHFGLRFPGVLQKFGPVETVSISNWATVKKGRTMQDTPLPQRATYLSKLEIFNHRGALDLPSSVTQDDLKNISFYSFWRLYSVQGKRLRKRQREKMLALNGCGWPRQAKISHALHQEYARKTLYAYAPCAGLAGTEYLDQAISKYFHNDWGRALKHFVEDFGNHWCPTWIKRNYCMENPPRLFRRHSRGLARTSEEKIHVSISRGGRSRRFNECERRNVRWRYWPCRTYDSQ